MGYFSRREDHSDAFSPAVKAHGITIVSKDDGAYYEAKQYGKRVAMAPTMKSILAALKTWHEEGGEEAPRLYFKGVVTGEMLLINYDGAVLARGRG